MSQQEKGVWMFLAGSTRKPVASGSIGQNAIAVCLSAMDKALELGMIDTQQWSQLDRCFASYLAFSSQQELYYQRVPVGEAELDEAVRDAVEDISHTLEAMNHHMHVVPALGRLTAQLVHRWSQLASAKGYTVDHLLSELIA